MRPDQIAGVVAAGLTLTACSPEEPSREPTPRTPAAAAGAPGADAAQTDLPAERAGPPARPASKPRPPIDPDPQAGVELPEPPEQVPENPAAG